MALNLQSKVIIVVGASQGIGAATVKLLASAGAKVILAGVSVELGRALASELVEQGKLAEWRFADLNDEESLKSLMDGVAADHGRIDGLFNNGADLRLLESDGDVLNTSSEIFERTLRADLTGYFLACRHVLPHMVTRGGGAIVQTSSQAASYGDPAMVGYSCAKAGVDALTRHIAVRWGKQNIRCNAIQPGLIMTQHAYDIAEALPLDRILSQTPSPRLGKPEDIAALATFLLSDEAAFMNGQILSCDGGMHMVLNSPATPAA
jgi:NAD(P)-dependent dehydrogenase (short-subunit alcohol dehydrogenase family)